jgi:arginine repressor
MFEKSEYSTQKEIVRDLLLKGERLTQERALNEYGIMRLASRIHDIRKEYGLKVNVTLIPVKNRFGEVREIAEYSL